MRKIKFEDPPSLKDPTQWDQSFVEMIKSCLIKDPQQRPTAEEVLKMNKKFFAKAKNKNYLVESLLKGIPTVQERVKNYLINSLEKCTQNVYNMKKIIIQIIKSKMKIM